MYFNRAVSDSNKAVAVIREAAYVINEIVQGVDIFLLFSFQHCALLNQESRYATAFKHLNIYE